MLVTLAVKRLIRGLQIPRESRLHSERFFSKKGEKPKTDLDILAHTFNLSTW